MNLFLFQNLFQAWFYSCSLSNVTGLLEWLWSAQPSREKIRYIRQALLSLGKCPGPNLCAVLHLSWCTLQTSLSAHSHDLGAQPGPPCFQESTVGLYQLPYSQTEPTGQQFTASYHSLLALLSELTHFFFFFIFLKVCFWWQASGDVSGDSLENIRKAINTVLGIISVTQIKLRVFILPTHLWDFGASVKIWINPLLQKNFVPVHN